jgi:PIN domain nuclease of toxin-antitoxin system
MDLLDASALLAYVKKEPGYEKISKLFQDAKTHVFTVFMHEVNYIEFLYKCFQMFGEIETQNIVASLQSPFFGVIGWKEKEHAYFSAYLKNSYKNLALGDAVGLSFTKFLEGRFWTADRVLEEIAKKEKIGIMVIR